jgi:hypothetical protein
MLLGINLSYSNKKLSEISLIRRQLKIMNGSVKYKVTLQLFKHFLVKKQG